MEKEKIELNEWMLYHIEKGNGPPTLFITLSCAELWWPDLRKLLSDHLILSGVTEYKLLATNVIMGDLKSIMKAVNLYTGLVHEFFHKRTTSWIENVGRPLLHITNYWGDFEFAKGRGQIHIHILAITSDQIQWLQTYYKLNSHHNCAEKRAELMSEYAYNVLEMTTDHPGYLDGNLPNELNWLPETQKQLLQNMAKAKDPNGREETTTSPSGIHMGIYKTEIFSKDICEVLAHSMSLPFCHGFSFNRWQHSVHHMLEKIPKFPHISKLRIIQILEADLNMYLKIVVGRRLLRHAEQHEMLPPEMYGGRRQKSVSDAIFQQTHIYDIAHQLQQDLICINLDAQKCFDRIYPNVAVIALQRLGLPESVCNSLASTLNAMSHSVNTSNGISESSFHNDTGSVMGGFGQGSAAAGPTCLAIEAPMITTMKQRTLPYQITSPTSNQTYKNNILSYVDDNNININTQLIQSPTQIATLIHDTVHTWEELLNTSGGGLSNQKCFYYHMKWIPKGRRNVLAPSSNQSIKIKTSTSPEITLREVDCTEPRRYLGIHCCPAGDNQLEVSIRTTQAAEFSSLLLTSNLSRSDIKTIYTTMWRAKTRFYLPHSSFTQNQCHDIQKPVISVIIQKLGFNKHFPRHVVFGHKHLGGLGLHDLFVEQGCLKLRELIYRLRCNDETSDLLNIAIQYLQQERGSQKPVLIFPNNGQHVITPTWLSHLWNFMTMYDITIQYKQLATIPILRTRDKHIMDCILSQCTKDEAIASNRCRLWLRVTTLAEITKVNGITLEKWAWHGSAQSPSYHKWPHTMHPTKNDWSLWRRSLKICFTTNDLLLVTPLGKWISHVPTRSWQYFLSNENNKIYQFLSGRYKVFHHNSDNRYSIDQYTDLPPKRGHPTEGRLLSTGILQIPRNTHLFPTSRNPPSLPPPSDNTLSEMEKQVLGSVHFPNDSYQSILHNPHHIIRVCASDGSVKDDSCTYSYLIQGDCKKNSFYGWQKMPPDSSTNSSLKAELNGGLGVIIGIHLIHKYHSLPPTFKFILYCDNKETVTRFQDEFKNTSRKGWLRKELVYEQEIRDILTKLECKITWRWIASHDNDGTKGAEANDIADIMTKKAWELQSPPTRIFNQNLPIIFLKNKTVTANEFPHIQETIQAE